MMYRARSIAIKISSLRNDAKKVKKCILIITSIALLLDNMVYMVIVPIIPVYLGYDKSNISYDSKNYSIHPTLSNTSKKIDDVKDLTIGILFASKAIIQLFISPISGSIIDKFGSGCPLLCGLVILFASTSVFAFGKTYMILFIARSLQGIGSAFADTASFSMIADTFTEEPERSAALGISIASTSFGSLAAPPFGGILFQFFGKKLPFIMLSLISVTDAIFFIIVKPNFCYEIGSKQVRPKGSPIWRLFLDPYIALCAGALSVANISLAFLEPTLGIWMRNSMDAKSWQIGFIWFPAFVPHWLGVYFTVWIVKYYSRFQWLLALFGILLEGAMCLFVPLCSNFWVLIIPISGVCFGCAIIDTVLLPTMAYLTDTRHASVYGSVYAIVDISYNIAYALGPIIAGSVMYYVGFTAMNVMIFVLHALYAPLLYKLKDFYAFTPLACPETEPLISGSYSKLQEDNILKDMDY